MALFISYYRAVDASGLLSLGCVAWGRALQLVAVSSIRLIFFTLVAILVGGILSIDKGYMRLIFETMGPL